MIGPKKKMWGIWMPQDNSHYKHDPCWVLNHPLDNIIQMTYIEAIELIKKMINKYPENAYRMEKFTKT